MLWASKHLECVHTERESQSERERGRPRENMSKELFLNPETGLADDHANISGCSKADGKFTALTSSFGCEDFPFETKDIERP